MPWKHEWVDPEIAFVCTLNSDPEPAIVHVYHAYKDDNWIERLSYWYTLHDGYDTNGRFSSNDTSHYEFDIRDVPTYHENQSHRHILQLAIDRGLVTIEDCFIYIQKVNNAPHDP
tara:strand:- start:1533 stop:1877 length:345 start_codon:yes stop_codon:yes gene_type:complete